MKTVKPSSNPNRIGKVYDARKRNPEVHSNILVFMDEVFDWLKGYYDGEYIVPSLNKHNPVGRTAVLYWTLLPPSSIARLRALSRHLRSK